MSDNNQAAATDLIYGLDAKPPALQAFFAGLQHLMAIFVGIVTPPIIISGALGLDVQQSSFIISMALFASGISTFIQVRKFGPIGSGLLSIQGTSFTFLGSVIAAGLAVKAGGGTIEAALATIFAVCFFGSFVEMIFSRFIPFLKKIITPLVSGIVVTLIGMSLIRVGITDIAGGQYVMDNVPEAFATLQNLGLAAIVLVVIVILNRSKNNFLRMSAIFIGLVVGYIVAAVLGKVNFDRLAGLAIIQAPIPLRYGLGNINWGVLGASLIPMMLLYLITTVESIGDLTATSMVSGEPIEGELYMKRIAGGVLGDGVNSAIAAIFNSFPNTTFSQNNGVIQMTGVASRKVGFWIAGMLAVVGLFPIVGGLFSIIPASVSRRRHHHHVRNRRRRGYPYYRLEHHRPTGCADYGHQFRPGPWRGVRSGGSQELLACIQIHFRIRHHHRRSVGDFPEHRFAPLSAPAEGGQSALHRF
jgi:xanthine permease XanP